MKISRSAFLNIVLATALVTSLLFMAGGTTTSKVPSKTASAGGYDPWLDYNGDGYIGIDDIFSTAMSFGSEGDPTKNVIVVNPGPGILPIVTWYIYSAPFIVCYNDISEHPNPYGVGPGTYETDILVHNPSSSMNVSIRKKLVEAFEEPYQGDIYPIMNMTLMPDGAFRIDSPEILEVLHATWPYYGVRKGYVVIIANSPNLDVTAVHTVTSAIGGQAAGLITNIETLTINPKAYT